MQLRQPQAFQVCLKYKKYHDGIAIKSICEDILEKSFGVLS